LALNRPGLRRLLALVMSCSRGARAEGRTVKYVDGLWLRCTSEGFVVSSEPDAWTTLADLDAATVDVWEYGYSPQANHTIVDVGAGVGTEIHRWSTAVGPDGRVVAIEAHPESFRRLQLFCHLNGLHNVTLVECAISDCEGILGISDDANPLAASVLGSDGTIDVRARALDEVLEELGVDEVQYLKMNIEGAEVAALHGMPVTLSRLQHLNVSCHDFRADRGHGEHFRTRERVASLLRASGFALDQRGDDPRPEIRDQVIARSCVVAPRENVLAEGVRGEARCSSVVSVLSSPALMASSAVI